MKARKIMAENYINMMVSKINTENTVMLYRGVPLVKFSKKYLIKIIQIIGNY